MKVLITGGAGFIGINAALHYLSNGHQVTILDNFSRRGSRDNVAWLRSVDKRTFDVIEEDVRHFSRKLREGVKKADAILHLAGQVAVTTSVHDPRDDFESNALGTLNILEAARLASHNPIILYSSTNKVYGGLESTKIREEKTRYGFANLPHGVSEDHPLDFHSPYGCSKGAGDQYVRDYHRIYGLNTVVFRQSCIYGSRQFGIEDQGWVAWFIIALMAGKNITIYGNGKQVRDLLHVDDLLAAYDRAIEKIDVSKGEIYNIGGGIDNSLSVWIEFKPILEDLFRKKISVQFDKERPGDQPIYISDIRKAKRDLGWSPNVKVKSGIEKLYMWVKKNRDLFVR